MRIQKQRLKPGQSRQGEWDVIGSASSICAFKVMEDADVIVEMRGFDSKGDREWFRVSMTINEVRTIAKFLPSTG